MAFVHPNESRSACLTCRNFVRASYKGSKIEDIEKTLDSDTKKWGEWLQAVTAFEQAYEQTPPGGRVRNAAARFHWAVAIAKSWCRAGLG